MNASRSPCRPAPRGHSRARRRAQLGQVLPVAVAGLMILATATIYAYQTTQLTLEKSGMVNAADAAAYSAAVEGARHMNFIAYTNRAMVANAIAGGMLTTYSSWARNLSEILAYFDTGKKGFFKQVGKIGADSVKDNACTGRETGEYESYADDAESGDIDEDGNVSGSDTTNSGGVCDSQSTTRGGSTDPWKRRNKGPVSGLLDVVADAVGYMTIPIDLLNGLYAASQWAAWGTANQDMEAIAREVAESHDSGYSVTVNYPEETLMADGFFSWALPKRPGLDGGAEIKVPQVMAQGVGGFLRQIPVLGGLIGADMRAAQNHSTSLMKNYMVTATTGNDQFYMYFSRGWRWCALLGPVCAPIPLNTALEHHSSTSAKVGADAGTSRSAWKNETTSRDSNDGWMGSDVRELLRHYRRHAHPDADNWRRVAGFPSIGDGVRQGSNPLGLQRMLGSFGGTQALADAISNTDAGQTYHFAELAGNILTGSMGDALNGMNWEAQDKLRYAPFVFDSPTNEHFFDGFVGGVAPFYAFGKMCPIPLVDEACFDVTPDLAEGKANVKEEWWRFYQGVWSYFTVPSAPMFGIDPPDMWIEVELEQTTSGGPGFGLPDNMFGFDLSSRSVDMKHAARAELYYHRQPNSPYADKLGASSAERTDSSIAFLPSNAPPGDRPRHFSQPEDNQSAGDMALRYWSSGKATQGSMLSDEPGPYTEGSYGLLENWFGKTLTWTFASAIERQHFPRDQGEYANLFAPMWEARLIADREGG